VDDVQGSGDRRSIAAQVARAFVAVLLAACIGLTAVAWKSYGHLAKKTIAALTTQFVVASPPSEKPPPAAQPAPPAVQPDAANAASPQPAALTQTAPAVVAPDAAPAPDSARLLESVARDVATLGQEVEELKASIEQLKSSQQQMSRDLAKPSGQNLRPKASAPPRPAAAQLRKPINSFLPPQAAAAPALPQTAAPYYVPRQPEPPPQITVDPQAELSSVPRPPMPLR
jgi:hypothetical protein